VQLMLEFNYSTVVALSRRLAYSNDLELAYKYTVINVMIYCGFQIISVDVLKRSSEGDGLPNWVG